MKELELKYGCNPNQKPSKIYMNEGELPIKVLCGRPGYINFLDAFNGWQLVKELKKAIDAIKTKGGIFSNRLDKTDYLIVLDEKNKEEIIEVTNGRFSGEYVMLEELLSK